MISLSELSPDVQASVRATRERVARLHAELPANGLVVWTAGNVSERVPGADLFVIKPYLLCIYICYVFKHPYHGRIVMSQYI